MTYSAAIALLQGIRQSGQILGLETMQELVRRLGDPHRSLRFIHIAGTNGKGSVAAMLRAMLTTAGYRTGLYTSPHLVSVRERFQIDGQMIAKNDLARLVEQLKPVADAIARGGSTIGSMQSPSPVSSPPATGARSFSLSRRRERVRVRVADSNAVAAMPGLREPTYFEFLTALALQYFHEQKVDVVVWETGLGGRLDATNIVTPLVSVITNIAFDHMQYLGNTLPEIAAEKAGIIKPGVPVVTAATGEALPVIRQHAAQHGSRLVVIGEQVCATSVVVGAVCNRDRLVRRGFNKGGSRLQTAPTKTLNESQLQLTGTQRDYGVLTIPLLGDHQLTNCATAVAALEASELPVTVEAVRTGLTRTTWPGRFQIVAQNPTVVLDGAHNAAGVATLVAALQQRFPGRRLSLIFGVLRDKDYTAMCQQLASLADRVFCVPVNSERTSDPAQIAELFRAGNPQATVEVCANVADALARARAGAVEVIVIAGSLFVVGEALALFGGVGNATELRMQ